MHNFHVVTAKPFVNDSIKKRIKTRGKLARPVDV